MDFLQQEINTHSTSTNNILLNEHVHAQLTLCLYPTSVHSPNPFLGVAHVHVRHHFGARQEMRVRARGRSATVSVLGQICTERNEEKRKEENISIKKK